MMNSRSRLPSRCVFFVGAVLVSGCSALSELSSFNMHQVAQDMVLFAPVEGRVLQHGVPKPGLKVECLTYWSKEKKPQQHVTETDALGFYFFPETKVSAPQHLFHKWFSAEPMQQYIYLIESGREVELYRQSRKLSGVSEAKQLPTIQLESDLGQATVILGDYYQVNSVVRINSNTM